MDSRKELELLKELKATEYVVFRFLFLSCDDKQVIHGINTEMIAEGTGLGLDTVYKAIRELKKRKLVEFNGQRNFCKILI